MKNILAAMLAIWSCAVFGGDDELVITPVPPVVGREIPNSDFFDFSSAPGVTVEVRVRIPAAGFESGRRLLLYKGSDTAENGWNFSWSGPASTEKLDMQSLHFNLSLKDKDYRRFRSEVLLKPGEWATLTVTLDGKNIRFYQNGHLLSEQVCAALPPFSKVPLRLGRYYHNKADFAGEMAQVRIARRAETPEPVGKLDIPQLYYRNFDLADRDAPAPAVHPYYLTDAQIELARKNIARYDWAKELEKKIIAEADQLAAIPEDQLAWHIPDEPGSACHCPNCGRNAEVAWRDFSLNDGTQLVCADCKTVFPNDKFPEDRTLVVKLPNGREQHLKYYQGKSISGNEGDRYFITGVIRERRTTLITTKIRSLGYAYALTGKKEYAEAARNILRRFAEVYPGYPPRLRNTYYENYGSRDIEGKLYRWKLGDSRYMFGFATLYDITYRSGAYSDADKVLIENGLFREYKRLMTAFAPWRDLTNSLPFGYAGMAHAGRNLADHEMIAWVVRGPQSLSVFMDAWFHRDGFWHENSCSYQNMTLGSMHWILEGLNGYSDPVSYRGRDRFDNLRVAADIPMLGKAYLAPATATMPDGFLAPLNDSPAGFRYNSLFAEYAVRFFDSPEAREILAFARGDADPSSPETLFNFDPETAGTAEKATVPDFLRESRIYPGPRWLALRGDYGKTGGALVMDAGERHIYHVHQSSLNFLYYDYGRELVHDLGYLGAQHFMTRFNKSILAHQTVMVDGASHYRKPDRKVEIDFFSGNRHPVYRAMRGHAPNAYAQVEKFERTMFYVDRGPGRRYAVDLFDVKGGKEHVYIFHAAGEELLKPEWDWQPFDAAKVWDGDTEVKHLSSVVSAEIAGPASFRWEKGFKDGVGTVYQLPANVKYECILADAPGNRDIGRPLAETKIKLLLLRRSGPESCFAGVIAGYDGAPVAREVNWLPAENGRVLEVKTGKVTELFLSSDGAKAVKCPAYPALDFRGRAAAVALEDGKAVDLFVAGGGELSFGDQRRVDAVYRGRIADFDADKRTITLDPAPPAAAKDGEYLVVPSRRDGFYRIRGLAGSELLVHDTAPYKLEPGEECLIYF